MADNIKNCSIEFQEELKKVMSSEEAESLYQKMVDLSDEKVKNDRMARQEALFKSREQIEKELEDGWLQEQYRKVIDLTRYVERTEAISKFENRAQGLDVDTVGSTKNVANARNGTAQQMDAGLNGIFGDLINDIETQGLNDTWMNPENELELAESLFGNDNLVKDEKINELGKVVKKHYTNMLNMLRKAGAVINELPEFIGKTSHNPESLQKTAPTKRERLELRVHLFKKNGFNFNKTNKDLLNLSFKRWFDYIIPRLDYGRTFGDIDPQKIPKIMRNIYNRMIYSYQNPYTMRQFEFDDEGNIVEIEKKDDLLKVKRPANLAKKVGAHRYFHFKDGTSWYEYNKEYGSGSVKHSIFNTLRSSENALVLMKRYGTNPRIMFEKLLNDSYADVAKNNSLKPSAARYKKYRAQVYFDMLDGTADVPVSNLLAKIGTNTRAWQTMSKLGGIIFSSFADTPMEAEAYRTQGVNFFGSYARAFGTLFKGRPKGEQKQIANLLGIWAQNEVGGMISRFSTFESPGGFTTKAMTAFFKLGFMDRHDNIHRTALASWMSRDLAMSKNKTFDELNQSLQSSLQLYGIDSKEWDLIRKPENIMSIEDGTEFITPDVVQFFTKDSLKEYSGKKRLSDFQADDIKQDIKSRLLTYFNDQTDQGNIRPEIADRFFWQQGTKRGTIPGEMMRFIGQFKYFGISYYRRIYMRKFYGLKQGLTGQMSVDIAGLANVLVGSAMFGYVIMNAKNVSKGRSIVAPDSWGAILASLLQGGGFGIFGDFLLGNFDRFGNTFLMDLLGPDISAYSDIANIIFRMKAMEDPANMMFSFAKNNMPFLNLPYVRIFADYLLLYGIQEKLSPGSVERYQTKLQQNTGQTMLVDPLKYSLIQP